MMGDRVVGESPVVALAMNRQIGSSVTWSICRPCLDFARTSRNRIMCRRVYRHDSRDNAMGITVGTMQWMSPSWSCQTIRSV